MFFGFISLVEAVGVGAAYDWNGFRKLVLAAGCGVGLGEGIGLAALLAGMKDSSRTCTKFDGNSPMARLSRRSRPIHHEPSPAFKHSMRSPSTKPKSFFDSPPKE